MIYLDSAATALQKPPQVARAVCRAISRCASPGRGSHSAAREAERICYQCREALDALLDAGNPEQVIFTSGATHSLNIAIRSLVPPGGSAVISGYEHNAVTRTLHAIDRVSVTVAVGRLFDPEGDIAAFRQALDRGADAVICTHVSNVFGYILPIDEIAALCRSKGVPLVVDASQSAGAIPVSLHRWGAEYVALPGHKGLCGIQGTGVLLCAPDSSPVPILTGGTGSNSREQTMPDYLPDRLEAGTHNIPGIAGLAAGVRYVQSRGVEDIGRHERRLADTLMEELSKKAGFQVFRPKEKSLCAGMVSFCREGEDCEVLADRLGRENIALRAGLHCAPLAHRTAGTLESGTVRVSFSPFSRESDISQLLRALGKAEKN